MTTDHKFKGWLGLDTSSANVNLVFQEFEPKAWTESDVDIQVSHCGICASDLHTLRFGWGATSYPCCVGHEIVGTAVRVGKDVVKDIKVGDRVGVGAQSASCLKPECEECSSGEVVYCKQFVGTYAESYHDGSGKSFGGYANYSRHPGHFVFKISEGLSSADAAPMLCAGITVYTPLKNNGCGPGKKVGIVGMGGLGHFGLLFAKVLGADKVTVISRTTSKKEDAMKMGADHFIATDEDGWAEKNASSIDLIISTVSSPTMPLNRYLQLLRTRGEFIQVGAPEENLPAVNAFTLIDKCAKIGGSATGSLKEIEEMLAVAVRHRVKPWIVQRPMEDANRAIMDMANGNSRYRYVLVMMSLAIV